MVRSLVRFWVCFAVIAGVTGPAWPTPTGIAFRSVVTFGPPAYTTNGRFAMDIAVLGDLNADGTDDLAVVNETNRVFILFMAANGSVASFLYHSLGSNGLPAGGTFSSTVESLGDLDGDGIVDIAVGSPNASYGSVWILFLNSNGSIKAYQQITRDVGGFTYPLASGSRFGESIANLGDIDGDGNHDVAVGSPQSQTVGSGSVWILDLSPAGLVTAHVAIPGVPGFDISNTSFAAGDNLGSAVEGIADLDGNGTAELVIGASNDVVGANPRTGSVWILFMNSDYSVDQFTTIGPGSGGLTQPLQLNALFGASLAWLPNAGCGRKALAVGAPGNADAVWFLMMNSDGTVDDDYVMPPNDPSFPYQVLNPQDRFGEGLA